MPRGGAGRRGGTESTAGEFGVEGEGDEDVGEGDGEGRGRFKGSFTLPSNGTGTPVVPGRRRRGGAWRGLKGSLTGPG